VPGNGKVGMSKYGEFIKLADVIGVQFNCGKCKARINLPLSNKPRAAKPSALTECPGCHQDWTEVSKGHAAVRQFIESLSCLVSPRSRRSVRVSMDVRNGYDSLI